MKETEKKEQAKLSLRQFVQAATNNALNNCRVLRNKKHKKFKDVQTEKFYQGQWSMGQAVLQFMDEIVKESQEAEKTEDSGKEE